MSVDRLVCDLTDVAPGGVVEQRGTLAVLGVSDTTAFADTGHRARALAAAAAHGVTHLALELLDDGDGDNSPRLPRA